MNSLRQENRADSELVNFCRKDNSPEVRLLAIQQTMWKQDTQLAYKNTNNSNKQNKENTFLK